MIEPTAGDWVEQDFLRACRTRAKICRETGSRVGTVAIIADVVARPYNAGAAALPLIAAIGSAMAAVINNCVNFEFSMFASQLLFRITYAGTTLLQK